MPKNPQSLFGRRLRVARERGSIAQDRLGVMIGLDEGSSSARISRYETGVHAPPFGIAESIANALNVPVAYFYCPDEKVAEMLLATHAMSSQQLNDTMCFISNLTAQTAVKASPK